MDSHCLSLYTCNAKQFDGSNIDRLAGKHKNVKISPRQNFALYGMCLWHNLATHLLRLNFKAWQLQVISSICNYNLQLIFPFINLIYSINCNSASLLHLLSMHLPYYPACTLLTYHDVPLRLPWASGKGYHCTQYLHLDDSRPAKSEYL